MDAATQALTLGPFGVAAVLLAISLIVFHTDRSASIAQRLLCSTHGAAFAAQLIVIPARAWLPSLDTGALALVMYVALTGGLLSTAASLYDSKLPRRWRLIHVATIGYGALANIYAYQALV